MYQEFAEFTIKELLRDFDEVGLMDAAIDLIVGVERVSDDAPQTISRWATETDVQLIVAICGSQAGEEQVWERIFHAAGMEYIMVDNHTGGTWSVTGYTRIDSADDYLFFVLQ